MAKDGDKPKRPRRNAKGQGRKRKPTAVKERQGNPGKRKLNEQEPDGGNVILFPGKGGTGNEPPKSPPPAATAGGKGKGKGKRARQSGEDGMWVPEEIAADPVAAGRWRELAPRLVENGVLHATDVNVLIGACQAWSIAQEARYLMMTTGGPVVEEPIADAKGNVVGLRRKRNPAAIQWKEALMVYRAYASELGLTPASRGALQVPGGRESSRDAFLNG